MSDAKPYTAQGLPLGLMHYLGDLDPDRVLATIEALERVTKERDDALAAESVTAKDYYRVVARAEKAEAERDDARAYIAKLESEPSPRSVAERQREACCRMVSANSDDFELVGIVRATPLVTDGGGE
jgi:hypothetical protein